MAADVDDRKAVDRSVQAIGAAELEAPVRHALGETSARVTAWRHQAVAYDFLNPSSGGVYRFAGTAVTARGEADWSLILKVTRSPEGGDDPVPAELVETRREAVRWDRELLAYESGFLGSVAGTLVAATCHGGVRREGETGWLWLEDLGGDASGPWPPDRWEHVARALGAFNGGFLVSRELPDHDWLGRRWLRVWATQLTPYHFGHELPFGRLWDDALVRRAYDAALRDRLERLWAAREDVMAAIEALPQTCAHLDAHRRNLFLRDGAVVAIDWGLLGLAAPGEEIASTLVGTVASGEAGVDEAEALAATLFDGYVTGLRDSGWNGEERDVRLGFAGTAGLRAFSVLRLGLAEDAALPADERLAALEQAAALARVLADLGEEARSLAG